MNLSEKNRAWVYRALVAGAPLLVFYGLATEAEIALWLAAVPAWLGLGLAAKNTSTR